MLSDDKRIAAIVLAYQRPAQTCSAVQDLVAQDLGLDILVLDNGSPDDSWDVLVTQLGDVKRVSLYRNDRNLGYARGNNLGFSMLLEHAKYDYILIVNNDVRVHDRGVVSALVEFMEETPSCAWVSPRVELPSGFIQGPYERLDLAQKVMQLLCPITRIVSRHRHQLWAKDLRTPQLVYRTIGAFLLLRTSVFTGMELFDENTFMYGEEDCLAERLLCQGWQVAYLPTVRVVHEHENVESWPKRRARWLMGLKSLETFFRHYHSSGWLPLLLLRLAGVLCSLTWLPLEFALTRISVRRFGRRFLL